MDSNEWFMRLAMEEAEKAYQSDEVPVGAIVVDSTGNVVAKKYNQKESNHNPCGHAEMLALTAAAAKQKNWRLSGHQLYVTLEPCVMCLSAMLHARIDRVIFGAYDAKAGALSLNYNIYKDKRLNHQFKVTGGICQIDCGRVLSQFFKEKRRKYKLSSR